MRILILLLSAILFSGPVAAATAEEDVARYVQIFNGDTSAHQEAVESLAWMGISDPRVFDVIERRLLNEAQIYRNDRNEKNRVARYIRALGFSGQSKYISTIKQYLSDRVYERYANTALEDLSNYQKWNPIISNRATFDLQYSDDVNRILNMLRSDDPWLKRVAAKRIYFANQDEVLLDMLAKELKAAYVQNNSTYTDVTAWMVKALGNAKHPKYRPLIEEVLVRSTESKVVSYAKQALELR
jgi:hypothetical protein